MKTRENHFENGYYLTDGGLETTLMYHYGMELRYFASFELLESRSGRAMLRKYFIPYLELAKRVGTGFVLETPTWRASSDWGQKMGYTKSQLFDINKNSVSFLRNLVTESGNDHDRLLYSGNIGPRGDGYAHNTYMTAY